MGGALSYEQGTPVGFRVKHRSINDQRSCIDYTYPYQERQFFIIDNLLVRIHFDIEMILVDRPRAMGVRIPLSR